MNPRLIFSSDVERPDESDYQWLASQARRSGKFCSGCKSVRSPIESAGAIEIDSKCIDGSQLVIANGSVNAAARELDVPPPNVRWFWPNDSESPENGWFIETSPKDIWLRATLRGRELERVIRHESAHYSDFLKGRPVSEERAEAFETRPEPFRGGAIVVTRPRVSTHIGGNYSL